MCSSEDKCKLHRSNASVSDLAKRFDRTFLRKNESTQNDRRLSGLITRKKTTTDYNIVQVRLSNRLIVH